LLILYAFLNVPGSAKSASPVVMSLLTAAALVVRSGLHVHAGWVGLNASDDPERAIHAANRYGSFGLISAFIAAGAAFISFLSFGGGGFLIMIGYVVMLCVLLAAWPLIIRTFFGERQFQGLMATSAGGQETPRRAPDMGLTALGWLLLALAVMALGTTLPSALFGSSSSAGSELRGGFGGPELLMALSSSTHSPWWNTGVAFLQLWAALALIRMSPHHRLASMVYGVAAAVIAIYLHWPALKSMGGFAGLLGNGKMFDVMTYWGVALALIVPVGTIALVNRQQIALARARYR